MSKKMNYFDTMLRPVEAGDRFQFPREGLVHFRALPP
jgi:hypothetical protein